MINSGDTAFVLISAALVCLMTPGLAFFYGGLVRKKNVLTIMIQSFISMGIVTAIWVLGGFSLAFGQDVHGIIGNFQYFALQGVGMSPNAAYGPTIPFLVFFIYQEMFAVITPALITGAFADRVSFKSYLKFLVLWSILVYIPLTHWIWGGGFLAQMGVVDFAGGIVVHVSAGIAALASVFFVGKRVILPGEKATPHNIAFVALGTGLLWFGWFGFNGGSALAANGIAATAFVNTDIAGSMAMITWLLISWIHEKKPTMVGVLTGAVAGLATITPAAGYIRPWAAVIVGILASIVCYLAVQVRIKLDWDDALDVWGVHGVGGILGSILVGVFAVSAVNGTSGLIEGNLHQFLIQTFGVVFTGLYAFVVTYAILKVINIFDTVRVPQKIEIQGLDSSIHGEVAYEL
ncbi:ammonium transporter [Desulfosporosinus orientis DSM 765]|uniref:Ammonium transporter n=1 Tax=Desulfosporosinus orientis (strain ATCC 19365 / DSM 765 / NCIMB 8382 / VKM B-1628 / Singapore I) TaxID=768706 RepID=G7WFX4_DESOD|nr:ammonium transporter [Desulfosporosinus orientis]AET69489.1 ammonium transporter [Desulfosporosinus orientis DSM 765]